MGSYIVIGIVYKQEEVLRTDIKKVLESIEYDSIELKYMSNPEQDTWEIVTVNSLIDKKFINLLCDSYSAEAEIVRGNRRFCYLKLEYSEDEAAIEIEVPEENIFQSDYSVSNIINKTDVCLQMLLLLNETLNCEYMFCDNEAQMELSKQSLIDCVTPIYSIQIFNGENEVDVRLGAWCIDGFTSRRGA